MAEKNSIRLMAQRYTSGIRLLDVRKTSTRNQQLRQEKVSPTYKSGE